MIRVLTRYVLREWAKVFGVTVLGFPILVIAIDLTDNLRRYLSRGVTRSAVLLGTAYSIPETMYTVLPAAVLFATVFTIGGLGRTSELTAAHASGISFYRLVAPLWGAALAATIAGIVLGEVMPGASRRRAELVGERARRARNERHAFVYRADEGWVYAIRELDARIPRLTDVLLERRGSGAEYPTIALQARTGTYRESDSTWVLRTGAIRYLGGPLEETAFSFDSMVPRILRETPAALLAEPKAPEEMRYAELGRYIEALERSGGDARKIKVDHALKLAVPITSIIITLFAAPLAITSPRQGMAWGVAMGLGTTVVFLILVQLSRAVGAGGVLPATVAAWIPNAIFGLAGLVLFARVRT